ncbi:UDP-N-acetylmuramoyl-L-alanine--D-glutamate ligase [Enterobacteriaceae endosymbiont of Neohaemonia nigricornis]|uniref:UDP-N-acetylmuramoyl-L-alanine--D-glutamate ligase n=1 Tax=Enterobacteriaceae endosymbiont of Neohaemonia nigricornis TaxID=2675792 RepID=UPI001ABF5736|nr:UDP-N-acetylmuramoyl-L-alanine--D-glutamate ligase [Enterobacteriaceae endosymbiont of Neohaemonia nigricornis]
MIKKINIIIGLGITGVSCINFFLKKGIIPYLMDINPTPIYIKKIPKFIPCCFGSYNIQWIKNAKLIVISPGISIFHPMLTLAKKLGIPIIGDIELFCLNTTTPIIAITGTNGKSTVIDILKKIIHKYKYNIGIGGNIGYPALDLLNISRDFYILELSSFQLETIKSLKAYIAMILNITEDHLDRYPLGFQQYRNFKLQIYNNANICIYNNSDKYTYPRTFFKDTKYVTFGSKNCYYKLYINNNNIFLKINNKTILNFKYTKLIGIHNYINVLAVLCLTDQLNIPHNHVLNIIKNYTNNPHTLQIINTSNGITWINDSKSTNVGSTKAALKYLYNKKKIWLLLGGYDKNCQLHLLKNYINKDNIIIYCFGTASNVIKSLYPKAIKVNSMKEALQQIHLLVKYGDIVLLSPACSSIDQFKNFKHRGKEFINIVKKLTTQ